MCQAKCKLDIQIGFGACIGQVLIVEPTWEILTKEKKGFVTWLCTFHRDEVERRIKGVRSLVCIE